MVAVEVMGFEKQRLFAVNTLITIDVKKSVLLFSFIQLIRNKKYANQHNFKQPFPIKFIKQITYFRCAETIKKEFLINIKSHSEHKVYFS